ncbi:MAG: Lipoprotein signal peptidase [Chlamydiia bacterium]|nr:Lipoprotein signal peptidase [Chlamydiia bacterium]
MKNKFLLLMAPFLFVCDFLLKKFVIAFAPQITTGDFNFHIHLLPFVDFSLAYVENTGIAWGMFASFQMFILFLRAIVIGVIIVGMMRSRSMRMHLIPLSFIVLGAFGNVLDTLMYGHVVDMLSFTFWKRSYGIFNIADAMIFIGAFMIMFSKKKSYVAQ